MTDANAAFSKSIGWAAGERTDRYALVVDHGKVVYAAREKTFGAVMASDAETVLSHL
jgi:alkyl hydroperoxide reductase 1